MLSKEQSDDVKERYLHILTRPWLYKVEINGFICSLLTTFWLENFIRQKVVSDYFFVFFPEIIKTIYYSNVADQTLFVPFHYCAFWCAGCIR